MQNINGAAIADYRQINMKIINLIRPMVSNIFHWFALSLKIFVL